VNQALAILQHHARKEQSMSWSSPSLCLSNAFEPIARGSCRGSSPAMCVSGARPKVGKPNVSILRTTPDKGYVMGERAKKLLPPVGGEREPFYVAGGHTDPLSHAVRPRAHALWRDRSA